MMLKGFNKPFRAIHSRAGDRLGFGQDTAVVDANDFLVCDFCEAVADGEVLAQLMVKSLNEQGYNSERSE